MTLTPLGAQVAQRGLRERQEVALRLLHPYRPARIGDYVAGVCYDTAAYVRYLLGAAITPGDLVATVAQNWAPFFSANGRLWAGEPIPRGTAVLFRRPNGHPFHLAVALGGTTVRAVNGLTLGEGWCTAGDANLLVNLRNGDGGFRYGPGQGDVCQVWLSAL